MIRHVANQSDGSVDIDDLTLTQKIYLGAILRAGVKEDFELIQPIKTFKQILAPSSEFEETIFDELYFNRITTIHPSASMDDFQTDYSKDTFSFTWRNIPLHINIEGDEGKENIIKQLLNPPLYEDAFTEESLEIWNSIIYWECVDLFKYRMETYGFSYKVGKDTKGFFESTIKKLPVSKIYSIIWNAAKNSAAYYQEGNVSRQQAANSTLSRMRNSLDKVLSGQWSQNDYNRPKDCPQSIISEYYFNSILKICDQGWYRKPALINNDSVMPFPSE